MENLSESSELELNKISDYNNDAFWDNSTIKIENVFVIVISLIGIIVNTIVCIIVFRKRKMQTSLNVFLVTLAISDVLYCLFCLIPTSTHYLLDSWNNGICMCYISTFVRSFYSSFTMIAISTSICLFLCNKVNLKLAYFTIIIISFCTIILALVRTVSVELTTYKDKTICAILLTMVYKILMILINIVLPFVVIVVSIIFRFSMFESDANPSFWLLLILLVIKVLLWSPLTILLIFVTLQNKNMYQIVSFLSHFVVVYKPIVYYVMNKNLKIEFLKLLSQCSKEKHREYLICNQINFFF